MSDNTSIQSRVLLVSFSSSLPGIWKKSKDITSEVAAAKGAKEKRVAATVAKFDAKGTEYAAVKKTRDAASNYHRSITGSWSDANSQRVTTSKGSTAYNAGMDAYEKDYWTLAEAWIAKFDDFIEQAKVDLGAAFDPAMFPTKAEAWASFSFNREMEMLPEYGHPLLDVSKEQNARIQAAAVAGRDAKVKALHEETRDRVSDILVDIAGMIGKHGTVNPDAKTDRAHKFGDSVIDRLIAAGDLISHLNVSGDEKVEKIADDIRARLTKYSPDELRGTKVKGDKTPVEVREAAAKVKRDELVSSAHEIADDIASVFG